MISFSEIGLQEELLRAIREMGFEQPTPIQEKTIPQFLSSQQDIIALAQTGTGKTAAFGLPLMNLTDSSRKDTQTLVLCPTRELCIQISKDLDDYSKYLNTISVVPVYGGASIDTQIRKLNKGAHIVVATPGRAKDLINRKKLQLEKVERIILDEADEMLSMGFQEDLDFILDQIPHHKQTALFSATMSKPVMKISRKYMDDPIQISVVAAANSAADNLDHLFYTVKASHRYEVLKRLADSNPDFYGIVFCRTRRETQETAQKLMTDGYNADALHGDLSQSQRDEVMNRFRIKHLQILVATDVAARGLDVDDLTHVINYNLPDSLEVYVHRSGRTGRAGKSGVSVAVITPSEKGQIKILERKFGIKFTKAEVPDAREICNRQLFALSDKIKSTEVNEEQIAPFMPELTQQLEDLSKEDLIKRMVSGELNRLLDYYKNAQDINASGSDRGERASKGKRRSAKVLAEIFINIGSKNKLKPARLIGLVNETLRSDNSEIGRIEILKNFSFFEIEKDHAPELIDKLNSKDFDGEPLFAEFSQNERKGNTKSDKRNKKSFHKKKGRFAKKKRY